MRLPLLRTSPAHAWAPSPTELARATRLLEVRSRREAAGTLVGGYRSAFQGSGIEFEEARPYVPGDDVRSIDRNIMARTGVPFVKCFREERDQTLTLVLDVSGSMAFGTAGRSKAETAAYAAALVTVAALRAGDRVGLITFDAKVRREIPPARGEANAWRVLRALVEAPGTAAGGTGLKAALARIRARPRRRGVVFLLSDFRDDAFFAAAARGARTELLAVVHHHDVVAVPIHDPREEALPASGALRLVDPEAPDRVFVLAAQRERTRRHYRAAGEVRRRALIRRLRGSGLDVVPLRTDQQPLRVLGRFFATRHATRGMGRQ